MYQESKKFWKLVKVEATQFPIITIKSIRTRQYMTAYYNILTHHDSR